MLVVPACFRQKSKSSFTVHYEALVSFHSFKDYNLLQDDGCGVVQLHGLTVRGENGKLQRARPSMFSIYI